MTIYPTGTCFDDVLDHQSYLVQHNQAEALRQHIVHGLCRFPADHPNTPDILYAHAWVEDDIEDKVYASGLLDDGTKVWWGCDRTEWYTLFRVEERTRYTLAHALLENWASNHFGPWIDRYRACCKSSTPGVAHGVDSVTRTPQSPDHPQTTAGRPGYSGRNPVTHPGHSEGGDASHQ